MNSKAIRRLNLEVLEQAHGSLAELERKSDGEVTASYLSQVKNGYRELGDKVAAKLEEKLSLGPGWMDIPHFTEERAPADFLSRMRERDADYFARVNVEDAAPTKRKLPLISWVAAGQSEEAFDPYAPGNAESWVDYDGSAASSISFYLRVRGRSMESPDGSEPTFPEGCLIGVDPRRQPLSREFAVFRFNDRNEATFKQLIVTGDLRELCPINQDPEYKKYVVGQDVRLVGTVFEKRMVRSY